MSLNVIYLYSKVGYLCGYRSRIIIESDLYKQYLPESGTFKWLYSGPEKQVNKNKIQRYSHIYQVVCLNTHVF